MLRIKFQFAFVVAMFVAASNLSFAGSVTYYHNDLSGSPVAATDSAGTLLWKENYKPYGERLNEASNGSNDALGFQGKEFDIVTGLSYMGERYYDLHLGRFVGVDPLGFTTDNVHSFNRYAFANNNPYKYVDPDGNQPLIAIASNSIAAVIGVITGSAISSSVDNPNAAVSGDPGAQWNANAAIELPSSTVTAMSLPRVEGNSISYSSIGAASATSFVFGLLTQPMFAKPPTDAYDKYGAKAPGKPGAAEGFKDPKTGEEWGKTRDGRSSGWKDSKGRTWVPTGLGETAHGGAHWDVQDARGGGYENIYPEEKIK